MGNKIRLKLNSSTGATTGLLRFASDKKVNGLTRDVWNVLDFLSKNETIQVRFPFYPTKVGNNVLNIFKNIKNKDGINKKFKNNVVSALKCETLYEFVKEEGKIWPEEEKRVLENIKIAHINFPFKDVNSQSTIMEIKMEKLGMQFFLTGDASNETFSKIVETKKDFFKKDEDYISFVMLPHHGSVENKTNSLFNLFAPDIIGISAGNGDKYRDRHPDKELVDGITERKYDGKVLLKNSFESMIMYQKREMYQKAKRDGFLFENSPKKMPFICTNLLGDIKISKDELSANLVFSAKFSSIFENETDGVSYEVDFSKHVDVPEFSDIEYKDRSIQKTSNGKYYLCVQYKSKGKNGKHKKRNYLYYHAYPQ